MPPALCGPFLFSTFPPSSRHCMPPNHCRTNLISGIIEGQHQLIRRTSIGQLGRIIAVFRQFSSGATGPRGRSAVCWLTKPDSHPRSSFRMRQRTPMGRNGIFPDGTFRPVPGRAPRVLWPRGDVAQNPRSIQRIGTSRGAVHVFWAFPAAPDLVEVLVIDDPGCTARLQGRTPISSAPRRW